MEQGIDVFGAAACWMSRDLGVFGAQSLCAAVRPTLGDTGVVYINCR